MTFHVAAEEMRRLAEDPEKTEKLVMYGLYKQAVHGDIPPIQDFSRLFHDLAIDVRSLIYGIFQNQ